MFFYSFSSYHSFDRVLNIQTTGGNPGDLFLIDGKYMLCLGETIAFQSLYDKQTYNPTPSPSEAVRTLVPLEGRGLGGGLILIEPALLSPLTIEMIHDFVNHRFTTYKNAIPLRLPDDIDTLLKRKPISKSKKKLAPLSVGPGCPLRVEGLGVRKFNCELHNIYNGLSLQDFNKQLTDFIDSETKQQRLLLFPSFWIMSQTLDLDYFKQKSGYLVMTSKTSPKQKDDAFRALKTGAVHTLITTHSQIFQDRYDLGYILIIDQHTRYYKNQQDPKYHTVDVCKSLSSIYDASIDFTGISLTI